MESLEISDESGIASSNNPTIILGEIVGATNLVAALRESHRGADTWGDDASIATTPLQSSRKNERVNSFCYVYWGDKLIHQTKTVHKK